MSATIERTMTRIKQAGIVVILRGSYPLEQVLAAAEALLTANVCILEVALNSQNALHAIAVLRKRFETDLLIGAGTVRTSKDVDAAIEAGAQFLVSPNFDVRSVVRSQAHDIPHLPGVFTPSEAQTAFAAGCRMLKLFPADMLGPDYLKAIHASLSDLEFVPTGGVSAKNLGQYVRAGAVAVGVGSALLTGPSQSKSEIVARAIMLREAWEAATCGS